MRVLHVTPYFEFAVGSGGPVKAIAELCRGLAQLGVEVVVLTTNDGIETGVELPLGQPVKDRGITVIHFPKERWGRFAFSRQMGKACKSLIKEFDVVHGHIIWWYPSFVAVRSAQIARIPYILSLHGLLLPEARAMKSLQKRLALQFWLYSQLQGAVGLHCTSEFEKDALAHFSLQKNAFVLPFPVDIGLFERPLVRGRLRQCLGIPSDVFVVLFMGRLHRIKGLDLALRGFALAAPDCPMAHMIIAGPDEEGIWPGLQQLASEVGVRDRIHWVGMLEEEEWLSAFADADLLLLTSHSENFGLVVVEAMAASLPVLVSDRVGLHRTISNASAGRVVSLDPIEIASALVSLLADPSRLRAMGENGRQLVERQYSSQAVAQSMLSVYQSLLWSGNETRG